MKIKYDIQEKYEEIEIHLCNRERSAELLEVRGLLENILGTQIKVHKNQEYKTVVPAEIVRIYSQNKRGFGNEGLRPDLFAKELASIYGGNSLIEVEKLEAYVGEQLFEEYLLQFKA